MFCTKSFWRLEPKIQNTAPYKIKTSESTIKKWNELHWKCLLSLSEVNIYSCFTYLYQFFDAHTYLIIYLYSTVISALISTFTLNSATYLFWIRNKVKMKINRKKPQLYWLCHNQNNNQGLRSLRTPIITGCFYPEKLF